MAFLDSYTGKNEKPDKFADECRKTYKALITLNQLLWSWKDHLPTQIRKVHITGFLIEARKKSSLEALYFDNVLRKILNVDKRSTVAKYINDNYEKVIIRIKKAESELKEEAKKLGIVIQ